MSLVLRTKSFTPETQTPILQRKTSILHVRNKKYLHISHTVQANDYLKKLQSSKLKANIPVLPLVTRLQFTALGCTELSSSRKKMPSDKRLS